MIFHKEEQLLFLLAEHDLETLDTAALKKDFRTEYENGVYRITLKQWAEHPHFGRIFFDEEKQLLLFSSMTSRSFIAMVKAFNAYGHDYPAESYLGVNLSMLSTAAEILDKKVVVNEYLDLFQAEADPEKAKVVEDINAFIALVQPAEGVSLLTRDDKLLSGILDFRAQLEEVCWGGFTEENILRVSMLPTPVREKGQRGHFPFILLMVDKMSGMVTSSSMLSPKPDLLSMYESVPQKVLEELLLELLREALEDAACKMGWAEQMPEIDEAISSMISHL